MPERTPHRPALSGHGQARRQLSTGLTTLTLLATLRAPAALASAFGREVRFSEAEVQAAVDRHLPQEKRLGEWGSVRWLVPPRLTLGRPQPAKVGLAGRAALDLLQQPEITVDFAGTTGIRYDDAGKAFHLEDPMLDQLSAPGLSPALQPLLLRALNRVLAQYFRSHPIYVLRPDGSTTEQTARWLLRDLRIEPGQVVARLSPL